MERCEFQRSGCTFKEWDKAWPHEAAQHRSTTKSYQKVFHQWEKVYSSFTVQYITDNKLNTKKEREIKFEQLEDDSEPQLFNFYIHPERKYNINKDYTVQNNIKQISTRRSSYVCFLKHFHSCELKIAFCTHNFAKATCFHWKEIKLQTQ